LSISRKPLHSLFFLSISRKKLYISSKIISHNKLLDPSRSGNDTAYNRSNYAMNEACFLHCVSGRSFVLKRRFGLHVNKLMARSCLRASICCPSSLINSKASYRNQTDCWKITHKPYIFIYLNKPENYIYICMKYINIQ